MITFVNTSAVASAASGDVTVTPPTTATDDIMVLAVGSKDTVLATLPAGWTTEQQLTNGSNQTLTMAWKRCVGAEGAFTVTHTAGAQIVARLAVYRGCTTADNLIAKSAELISAINSIDRVGQIPSAHAMAVFIMFMNANTTGFSNFRSFGSGQTQLTERFLQFGDTTGSGANTILLDLADGILGESLNDGNFICDRSGGATAPLLMFLVLNLQRLFTTNDGYYLAVDDAGLFITTSR